MRYLTFTFLLFAALTAGCATNSQQVFVTGAAPIATPKATFDQAAIERLSSQLSEETRQILAQAEDFEIIALKPGIIFSKQKVAAETLAASKHWRFAVVGKTKVTDSVVKDQLLESLYGGLVEAQSNSQVLCFAPRHAIRARSKGKTVELVICFDCNGFLGSAPSGWIGGVVTKTPRETFNRIYSSAGLEIQP